ncbi:MAG: hypothetical protein WA993_08685 [Candidatus Binatus sp.]|jgi:hypothetical protein|uniref:hypothetical protein n=1 Tax=Candidatus Binatus sp. TaxID=2811406 RepID=UPI003CA2D868
MSEFKGTVKLSTDRGINRGPSAVRFQLSFTDGQVTADVNIAMEGITITSDPSYREVGTFNKDTGELDLPIRLDATGFSIIPNFSLTFPGKGLTTGKGTPVPPFYPKGTKIGANGNIVLAGATTISGTGNPLVDGAHVQVELAGTIDGVP